MRLEGEGCKRKGRRREVENRKVSTVYPWCAQCYYFNRGCYPPEDERGSYPGPYFLVPDCEIDPGGDEHEAKAEGREQTQGEDV